MWLFALTFIFYAIIVAMQIDEYKRVEEIKIMVMLLDQKLDEKSDNAVTKNDQNGTDTPPDER